MTFFLPTDWSGRVKMGAEARIILDSAPQFVIPATVTFVADVAQFTPKTVETAEERQKLTFRIKARIEPELLKKHIRDVKTGLPGMAYVKFEEEAQWPDRFQVRLPETELESKSKTPAQTEKPSPTKATATPEIKVGQAGK